MKHLSTSLALLTCLASPLAAGGLAPEVRTVDDALLAAQASGVCGEYPVLSVSYDPATGISTPVCGEDAEAFVPLLGGFVGPALAAAGAGLLLGATGGGGGPADTVSP
ncbi:hypothetical protein SAMN04488003_11930 [Loktanella fryxellensis]|uniref:Uncharacterized protein n=1 Tax=Loktanella fryxellensis TaxID=245187 RepID=A0A1H8H6H9_9RHOB|nr:hypothetical protein [Loktanella fryxellensis]SEN51088.1 hypothetical protein SAMN04488003_11930 [Loktanella fryxellensis]